MQSHARALPLSLLLLLTPLACGGDKDGTSESTAGTTDATDATNATSDATEGTDTTAGTDATETGTGSDTETTGAPVECNGGVVDTPIYDPPGDCYNNGGCASCLCVTFRDSPPDPGAMCAEPAGPETRVTGTVLEFPGDAAVSGVKVDIVNAISVLGGIDMAPAVASAMTGGDGRVDLSLVPTDQIGIVAVLTGAGYFATATGIAPPPYEPGNAVHDLYIVPEASVTAWSAALMDDGEIATYLPLGEMGGVVGVARNRYTGTPVAGLTLVSKTNGPDTTAIIRYLNDDGTFNATSTTDTGVYVLVNPSLAEEFEAELDGAVVSTRANKAGSGNGGVFTMNLSIDIDPGFNPFE